MAMNPFCEIAVEEAIRLKEAGKAEEVIVVSIGEAKAQETLRTALAMGADRGIHILVDHDVEPLGVAKVLQKVIEKEGAQLAIMGKQSIDGDNNQTGQMLSALLNWSQATFVSNIDIADGHMKATREIDGGLENVNITMPAVVTTDLRLNEPRYASLPNIMKAKKKPIDSLTTEELGVDVSPRIQVVKVAEPEKRQAAEHDNAALVPATLNTITAASQLGDVEVLVAGSGCQAAADTVAAVAGVSKVLVMDSAEYAHPLAENVAWAIKVLVEKNGYSHVLANATTQGKNTLPRASALLDVQQLSDITAVIDADTFERPIYAGNAIATVKSSDAVKLMTVRSTAFESAAETGGSASIEAIGGEGDSGLSSFVNHELTKSDRPELTSAGIVISGGRGMGSAENFQLLDKVADKLGAAVGASRAAVDAGYAPNDYQVGQTGKVIAPDLYIAVGAIQHLAGMKDSKVIVAINTDEEAPIFQLADYGLVADLFNVLPELE
eukprot:maker-scaffold36_size508890-snap-gene-1.0 protein:Tk03709 transcript:maker-scaffold36_size508890-snap-gene-1.0-mRNA-1 annotation:"electron transfer flavoprotein subunit alpha"